MTPCGRSAPPSFPGQGKPSRPAPPAALRAGGRSDSDFLRPLAGGLVSAVLAAALALLSGCGARAGGSAPPETLEEALGRLREAFERGEPALLEGLYPEDWAVAAFAGEPARSASGPALRRRLARLFHDRAPLAWRERPDSIHHSPDGDYVLLSPEWTSMALGEDRMLTERFRIGLERVTSDAGRGWRLRELSAWTR